MRFATSVCRRYAFSSGTWYSRDMARITVVVHAPMSASSASFRGSPRSRRRASSCLSNSTARMRACARMSGTRRIKTDARSSSEARGREGERAARGDLAETKDAREPRDREARRVVHVTLEDLVLRGVVDPAEPEHARVADVLLALPHDRARLRLEARRRGRTGRRARRPTPLGPSTPPRHRRPARARAATLRRTLRRERAQRHANERPRGRARGVGEHLKSEGPP